MEQIKYAVKLGLKRRLQHVIRFTWHCYVYLVLQATRVLLKFSQCLIVYHSNQELNDFLAQQIQGMEVQAKYRKTYTVLISLFWDMTLRQWVIELRFL